MASIGPYCSLLAGQSMASDVCIAAQPWCGVAVWSWPPGAAPQPCSAPASLTLAAPQHSPAPAPAHHQCGERARTANIAGHQPHQQMWSSCHAVITHPFWA